MSTQTDTPTFSVRAYEMPFEGMAIFDAESFVDATEYDYLIVWEDLPDDWLGGIDVEQVPHLPNELGDRAFYVHEDDFLGEIDRPTFHLYYEGEYDGPIAVDWNVSDDTEWVEIANHEWDAATLRIIPERYVFEVESRGGYVVTADDVKHSRPNVEAYQNYEIDPTHLHDFSTYVWEIRDGDLIDDYLFDPTYGASSNADTADEQYGVGDDANDVTDALQMFHYPKDSTDIPDDEPTFEGTSFDERVTSESVCTSGVDDLDEDTAREAEQLIAEMYGSEGAKEVGETLDEVQKIIMRRDGDGDPKEIHESIAQAWSWLLDTDVTATDVARMMALLKMARSIDGNDADRDDDLDAVGYTAIAAAMGDD